MAAHGWWCHPRVWPMLCRYCGQRVFFYQCDHESKVFFDDLGDPWPKHDCGGYTRSLGGPPPSGRRGPTVFRRIKGSDALTPLIESKTLNEDVIDDEVLTTVEEHEKRAGNEPFRKIDAAKGQTVDEMGIVREFFPSVDLFARLRVPSKGLGAKWLGALGREPIAQVTVHVGGLAAQQQDSYTFYVARRLCDRLSVEKGSLVEITLVAHLIPEKANVWRCTKMKLVMG